MTLLHDVIQDGFRNWYTLNGYLLIKILTGRGRRYIDTHYFGIPVNTLPELGIIL